MCSADHLEVSDCVDQVEVCVYFVNCHAEWVSTCASPIRHIDDSLLLLFRFFF